MTHLDSMIRFIGLFGYTTPQILVRLMRIKKSANYHYHTISKAKKLGFVEVVKHGIFSENLIFLTTQGMHYAMAKGYQIVGEKKKSPRNFSSQMLTHDLCTQMFVAKQIEAEDLASVDTRFVQSKSKHKVPDLIISSNFVKGVTPPTAIEIEITNKSKLRIYDAFYNHIETMKRNPDFYNSVIYVFPDNVKHKYYSKLFKEDKWPVIENNNGRKKFAKRALSDEFMYVHRSEIPQAKNFRFSSFQFDYNFKIAGGGRG